jgi:hypothetical protein
MSTRQNNQYFGNKVIAGRGGLIVGNSRDAIYNAVEWTQWSPVPLANPDHDLIDSSKNVWFQFGDNVTLLFNVLVRKIGVGSELNFLLPSNGGLYNNTPPLPDGLINTNYATGVQIRDDDTNSIVYGDATLGMVVFGTQKVPMLRVTTEIAGDLSDTIKYRLNLKIEYKADNRLVQSENARGAKNNHFNF